jgi:hypothetical protein
VTGITIDFLGFAADTLGVASFFGGSSQARSTKLPAASAAMIVPRVNVRFMGAL